MKEDFSVGDIVVANGVVSGKTFVNKIGKIISIFGDITPLPNISVEFDEYIKGHTGDGTGKKGHCWNMYPETLSKINASDDSKLNTEETEELKSFLSSWM